MAGWVAFLTVTATASAPAPSIWEMIAMAERADTASIGADAPSCGEAKRRFSSRDYTRTCERDAECVAIELTGRACEPPLVVSHQHLSASERRVLTGQLEMLQNACVGEANKCTFPPADVRCIAGVCGDCTTRAGYGYITLGASPAADVFVDGRRIGETPINMVALPAGCVEVKAVARSLRRTEKVLRFVIRSGKTVRYHIGF